MQWSRSLSQNPAASIVAAIVMFAVHSATAQPNTGEPQILSTGQLISPLAPNGARFQPLNPHLADNPEYTVGQAVTTAISPDGKTLLILTSGYNQMNYTVGAKTGYTNPVDSTEFVFIFDVSSGNAVQKQALPVPNTYSGIAFNPNGQQFYVAGGKDDAVHIFGVTNNVWSEAQTPIALGHLALANPATSSYGGLGLETYPMAAGLAVSQNGQAIVLANYENDTISVLNQSGSVWAKSSELDLRPGVLTRSLAPVPGGEYPYWVSIKGNSTAYVSCVRDREIDVVNIAGTPSVRARIKVSGSPNRSLFNQDQSLLYVAQDNSDSVVVIDTDKNKVIGDIKVTAPHDLFRNEEGYKGANPNSLALSPDGRSLYVTDGGLNAVAVISLSKEASNSYVAGLIPTGFYPNSVSVSADGKHLYIVNGKSANGPNPQYCHNAVPNGAGTPPNCYASNQYDLQLTKAGFQTVPIPSPNELSGLTQQVLQNNHFARTLTPQQKTTMVELHKRIQHVIYIIKENRTYDQMLGDLGVGNGDPDITQFGASITPNLHALASDFVDFDNFFDVSEVSGDGWPWSTSARTTDTIEKEIPVNYAGRGGNDNGEGTNRGVNVGISNFVARVEADPLIGTDPNLLPGSGNVAAPDSAEGGVGEGYIWNAAHHAGLSVRNYGFFIDLARYNLSAASGPLNIPEDPTPFADNLQVSFCTSPFLALYTDIYYRGFDNSFPDYFRFTEWNREFQQFDAKGNLPNLSLVRLMHDHTGNYTTSINGVNTPELDEADNDYAVGLLIQGVATSKNYKDNTLIFVIEDDSQDGGDHVDAHRSIAFIVGPYVKHRFVDSSFYNTVSMLRTIEDVLGTPHLNLNDALAQPMADAFDLEQREWSYKAVPSAFLVSTTLPIPKSAYDRAALLKHPKPLHDAAWWTEHTGGFDFSVEDHLDAEKYNGILWAGTMGNKLYPTARSGLDLRANRAELLKAYEKLQADQSPPSESK
ncbi:MAG: bifunctional YncE family protein/alkaline phosphatase family protein [Terracidiphilus sp.]